MNSDRNSQPESHPAIRAIDAAGYYETHDGGRIAPDVDLNQISRDAVVRGNSLIEGGKTRLEPHVVIEDSYCLDAVVATRSRIRDSVLRSTGRPKRHACDAAERYVVQGEDIHVGPETRIEGCQIIDSSVGPSSRIVRSLLENCTIGAGNTIFRAKVILVHSERAVAVEGPTEVSEAWLGRNTRIDRLGYFEGVFSNEFPVLHYDPTNGQLSVPEILDIPHVSRFGSQVIHSTNSGRLLPQPDGIMQDFGPQVRLWHDPLLAHEPVLVGPCCWICSKTKVIGESARVHADATDRIQDRLHTHLMPFSVAGLDGESVLGLVFAGEANGGFSHQRRTAAWPFTFCPQAVLRMVARLHQALDPDEKSVADTVVERTLQNALCLIRSWAEDLGIDLNQTRDRLRGSRSRWLWDCQQMVQAHLESGIWKFQDGRPIGWVRRDSGWHHPALDPIRQSVPGRGVPEREISEEELLAAPEDGPAELEDPFAPEMLADTTHLVRSHHPDASIDPAAVVHPSARIGAGVRIGPHAFIGPGTVLEGNTSIGQEAWLFRSVVRNASVGPRTRLARSILTGTAGSPASVGENSAFDGCSIDRSELGAQTTGQGARVTDSRLAVNTTLSMFARIERVQATWPSILGSPMTDCRIETNLMSMHAAGSVVGLHAHPVTVEAGDRRIEIPAIPMIGGGCQIRGELAAPVQLEGAFLGSNSVLEAGSCVGFGSFVLGRLGPEEGLLPFTVRAGPGPESDEIGGVLTRFPNMVITHFIGWTYQALPRDRVEEIVHLIPGQLVRGRNAIRRELDRRQHGRAWDPNGPDARYQSLPVYSLDQLRAGLKIYEDLLALKAWDLIYDGDQLRFANTHGHWRQKNGTVRWHAS